MVKKSNLNIGMAMIQIMHRKTPKYLKMTPMEAFYRDEVFSPNAVDETAWISFTYKGKGYEMNIKRNDRHDK